MKAQHVLRVWVMGMLALAMIFGSAVQAARASDGNFSISVYHGINGQSLGLSKALPVDIQIWKDGALLATLEGVTFGTRYEASLPAGEYEIRVFAVELGGARLDSMTVGPVMIGESAEVSLQANLSSQKTPVIKAKIK